MLAMCKMKNLKKFRSLKCRGIAIILDAFIALIFVLTIFTIYYGLTHSKIAKTSSVEFKKLHYLSEDILDVLNKAGILDIVGEEWAYANYSTNSTHWQNASILLQNYLEKLLPENVGYEITIDEITLCNSENLNNSKRPKRKEAISETHSTRLLVGYGAGLPTRGHVARAFLSQIREKETSAYVYFGGFEGQGNLTKILTLPSTLDSVKRAYIEMASGSEFKLYVNDHDYGTFTPSGKNMSANIRSYLPTPNLYFHSGENTIKINFLGSIEESYIGGGFIKITYNTSEMETENEKGTTYYYFPGIDGLINLYSSFYVPGNLNSIKIYLKFLNNFTTYLNFGNIRVFQTSGKNSTQEIYLYDSNLTMLDYNDLSLITVPLRLGVENISFIVNATGNADVVLITDVSGSMDWRLDSSNTGIERNCNDPLLYSGSTKRISLAKCLDNEFIDIILNTTGNRVGLVAYSGIPANIPIESSTIIRSYHDLSTNKISLKTQVNGYYAQGATGICGAIRQARKILQQQSNASRQKFIIVMTDGLANVQCSQIDENSTIGCVPYTCPTDWFCLGGGCLSYQCGDYISEKAANDAINDSCKTHNLVNATIYSIGFGPVGNCPIGNLTLRQIALCGNGSYYSSMNATELKEIYGRIAQQIVNSSYKAQSISIVGNLTKMILYPESYIKFSYTPTANLSAYGEITITQNTERFNNTENCTGNIFLTEYARVVDAKLTSYSGEYWTDLLRVNGLTFYSLRDGSSGDNYLILGDPFIVQIPNPQQNLIPGRTNYVEIKTGNSPTEDTGCSADNIAIYTLRLDGKVGYGSVFPEKDGCNWKIQFEDNSYLEAKIPESYTGNETCIYSSTNILYDSNDAIDDATYRLIEKLDSDNNGKIDIKFDSNMLVFDFSRAGGVRSLWGPITLKLILWE